MKRNPTARLARLSIGLAAAWIAAAPAAEIYRSVDEQGNVSFSDLPPREGAVPLDVTPPNTYSTPAEAATAPAPGTAAATLDAQYYRTVQIVDPAPDAAVRENAGNLVVAVATAPPVRSDHHLVLVMDGRKADAARQGNVFRLTNVDRGTHTVVARVVDGTDATIAESAPVTFHMLRVHKPLPAPPPKPKPKPSGG